MRYRFLGKTGFRISEIGFGCWAIGGTGYGPVRDEDSLAALEFAWINGVNFYDTADVYGDGHSEEILSRFLKLKPRDQIFIASKVGNNFYNGPVKKDFSPAYIQQACEKSLKRLGVEAIDVYQLHSPSLEIIERGEATGALEKLKTQGKIRAVGISLRTEEEAFAALKDPRVESIQLIFNLIDQRMAPRVLPLAKQQNVGVIAREPLACGVLTGKYQKGHKFIKTDHRYGWGAEGLEQKLAKVEMLKTVLATQRVSLTRAALEYILEFEEITTAIPGAKTQEQVRENVLAVEEPLLRSQETMQIRNLYFRDPVFKSGF